MVGSGKIMFLLGVVVMLAGNVPVKALASDDNGNERIIYEQKTIHKEPLAPAQSAQSISGQDEKAKDIEVLDTSGEEKQDPIDAEIMKRLMELLQKMLGEGNSEGLSKELIDQLSGQEKRDQKNGNNGFKEWNGRHEWEGLRKEKR